MKAERSLCPKLKTFRQEEFSLISSLFRPSTDLKRPTQPQMESNLLCPVCQFKCYYHSKTLNKNTQNDVRPYVWESSGPIKGHMKLTITGKNETRAFKTTEGVVVSKLLSWVTISSRVLRKLRCSSSSSHLALIEGNSQGL